MKLLRRHHQTGQFCCRMNTSGELGVDEQVIRVDVGDPVFAATGRHILNVVVDQHLNAKLPADHGLPIAIGLPLPLVDGVRAVAHRDKVACVEAIGLEIAENSVLHTMRAEGDDVVLLIERVAANVISEFVCVATSDQGVVYIPANAL